MAMSKVIFALRMIHASEASTMEILSKFLQIVRHNDCEVSVSDVVFLIELLAEKYADMSVEDFQLFSLVIKDRIFDSKDMGKIRAKLIERFPERMQYTYSAGWLDGLENIEYLASLKVACAKKIISEEDFKYAMKEIFDEALSKEDFSLVKECIATNMIDGKRQLDAFNRGSFLHHDIIIDQIRNTNNFENVDMTATKVFDYFSEHDCVKQILTSGVLTFGTAINVWKRLGFPRDVMLDLAADYNKSMNELEELKNKIIATSEFNKSNSKFVELKTDINAKRKAMREAEKDLVAARGSLNASRTNFRKAYGKTR